MLLDESGNVDTSKFNTLAPVSPQSSSKPGSRSPVASFPAKSDLLHQRNSSAINTTNIQEEISMDRWNEHLMEMSLENSDRFISYNQSPRSPIASDYTEISKNYNM